TAGALFCFYFRGRSFTIRDGVFAGLLWLGINLAMDYPMFSYGPMKMSAAAYYSEIGINYLTFPAFGFWASRIAGTGPARPTGPPMNLSARPAPGSVVPASS